MQRPFCEADGGSVGQHREQPHRGHEVRPHAHPLGHFGIWAPHERHQLVADQEEIKRGLIRKGVARDRGCYTKDLDIVEHAVAWNSLSLHSAQILLETS